MSQRGRDEREGLGLRVKKLSAEKKSEKEEWKLRTLLLFQL